MVISGCAEPVSRETSLERETCPYLKEKERKKERKEGTFLGSILIDFNFNKDKYWVAWIGAQMRSESDEEYRINVFMWD